MHRIQSAAASDHFAHRPARALHREQLLARRGERVRVDDIRAIAVDVLRGMQTQ
jgi:hypothetical protein